MAGDSVGIVACGGPIRHFANIIMAKLNILRLGLLQVLAPHLSDVNGYLAGAINGWSVIIRIYSTTNR